MLVKLYNLGCNERDFINLVNDNDFFSWSWEYGCDDNIAFTIKVFGFHNFTFLTNYINKVNEKCKVEKRLISYEVR